MTATFCGHSDVLQQEDVRQWLFMTVEELILQDTDMFLLGGYGGLTVWRLLSFGN